MGHILVGMATYLHLGEHVDFEALSVRRQLIRPAVSSGGADRPARRLPT